MMPIAIRPSPRHSPGNLHKTALLLIMLLSTAAFLRAQTPEIPQRDSEQVAFARKVELSKELGATHVLVTDGLPLAAWEMDPTDPYPMWFVHHAGLLTIFPSQELLPYVDTNYAAEVSALLRQRCALLGRAGLKAVWSANEPEVLPEAFFVAHPELRGPRIDQPNRSRKAYFAPNVDQPEMLRLYRESMQKLLQACPEVEQFSWVTTDAGSGFGWTPSLYPGLNGNTNFRERPLADRVSGFLINAQQAAKEAGHQIEISLLPIAPRLWMIPTFSPDVLENTVRKLPRGIAIQGREGPDGRPFATIAVEGSTGAFYPIAGLVVPKVSDSRAADSSSAGRTMINFGDQTTIGFNERYVKFTHTLPMHTLAERVAALRAFAAQEAGEPQADNLLEVWDSLNRVQDELDVLDFGSMLRFGHVLNRWITRPMVPFPDELTEAETKDYRPFLFQAKGEAQASDLVDIQGMRMYEGWGARLLFEHDIELALPHVRRAIQRVNGIADSAKNDTERRRWERMSCRLQALAYLLESANHMVSYQAQLDRVKAIGEKPEANPVLGTQSSWDRADLMQLARSEIDTMVNLQRLLETSPGPILDLAPSPRQETIMQLGPDTAAAIRHKIDVMNQHWRDYDRLFTAPNP